MSQSSKVMYGVESVELGWPTKPPPYSTVQYHHNTAGTHGSTSDPAAMAAENNALRLQLNQQTRRNKDLVQTNRQLGGTATVFDEQRATVAIQKLKTLTLFGSILGGLMLIAGVVTLVEASDNIGFPVFNFGPLLTGLVYFIAHALAFWKIKTLVGHTQITAESIENVKCTVVLVFVVSILCVTLAVLSGVFSLLSGITCAGGNIQWQSTVNGVRRNIDTRQFCYPNDTANAAMGFIDAVLGLLVALWCIVGCVFFCMYGNMFGIKSRGRVGM